MNKTGGLGPFSPDDISDWFWSIVASAHGSRNRLKELLMVMPQDDLIRFHNEFEEASVQLIDDPFIDYLPPGTSEDSLQDISNLIVSQGKSYFAAVWSTPSKIADFSRTAKTESYSGVSDNVYWDRFNDCVPTIEL